MYTEKQRNDGYKKKRFARGYVRKPSLRVISVVQSFGADKGG